MRDLPEPLMRDFTKAEKVLRDCEIAAEEWLEQLGVYAGLLYHWSGKMNLISSGDRDSLVTRHLLPSLAMLPIIRSLPHRTILDFGSGGGLPGVPLKIALPETKFTLLEARRRRANFLRVVVRELGLRKVEVVNARAADWRAAPAGGVDLVVSRAVSKPQEVVAETSKFLAPSGGVLLSLSARGWSGKIGDCPFLLKKEVMWGGVLVRLGLVLKGDSEDEVIHTLFAEECG